MLRRALHAEPRDEAAQPPAGEQVSQEQRRRLQHNKAEAIALHNEGARLARYRQKAETFTPRELEVLQKWDSGELLSKRNEAIVAVGHGRLQSAQGDYLDIGGSTGGGSRRIIDSWQPPDWRDFLQYRQDARSI